MQIKNELAKVVGKDYVSESIKDREKYSQDYSLLPPGLPDAVVWPGSSEEVGKVVTWANENNIPVVPVSSKVHFHGCSIPKQGGIVVDLSRMNKIFEIDVDNRLARFEAGVTWEQLTTELAKKGHRAIMPLMPHPERSVLTDTLEREVPTNIVYDYGEPMQSVEVVWPTGELFRCGSASVNGFPDSISRGANPSGPGLDFYRFFQLAQGTMGIVTWMSLKIETIPTIDKIFFAPVYDLDYAMSFLYRILPRRIGQECLLLNSTDLAALVADTMPDDFDELRAKLPPWTLILTISGLVRRPEEKIAYEEKFLAEVLRNEFPKMGLPTTSTASPDWAEADAHASGSVAVRPALLEEPGKRRMSEPVLYYKAGARLDVPGGCGARCRQVIIRSANRLSHSADRAQQGLPDRVQFLLQSR